MRISKVYTRKGDSGKTRLAGGQEILKDSIRVEAYGTVDELNSTIGLVRVSNATHQSNLQASDHLERILHWVQNKLFDLGSILATVPGQSFPNMPTVTAADVSRLEHMIDECQKDLSPLKEFILPGGGPVSAPLHLARTVCRRAERLCVTLSTKESVDTELIKFLNRLSDALFVFARWIGKQQGESELLWQRDSPTS